MKHKQSWETDLAVSLGTKSMQDGAPRFPPAPLVPIRDRVSGQPAGTGLGIRISPSPPRHSCDSDASSFHSQLTNSPPQRGGLRPPPALHLNTKMLMPTIPGSPNDELDIYGISPLMARAPPPVAGPAPAPQAAAAHSAPIEAVAPKAPARKQEVVSQEPKRLSGSAPRSPLSPIRGFLASRQKRKSVPAPPPIITTPPRQSKFREEKTPDAAVALQTVGLTPPPIPGPPAVKPIKRKTVWGVIDGWWDLGLVERMNTIKKKNNK